MNLRNLCANPFGNFDFIKFTCEHTTAEQIPTIPKSIKFHPRFMFIACCSYREHSQPFFVFLVPFMWGGKVFFFGGKFIMMPLFISGHGK